jgi:hypothetical protein
MTTSILNQANSEATNSETTNPEAQNPETKSSVPPLPAFLRKSVSEAHPLTALSQTDSRCLHRYPNGKRCRLPGLASQFGFCTRHIYIDNVNVAVGFPRAIAPSDSEDLSADLLPELSQPDSPVPIKQFVTRLLILLAKGRITPRRAAVLSYLSNQLRHVSSRRST